MTKLNSKSKCIDLKKDSTTLFRDTSPTMRWTIESYEYQNITSYFFEAGVLARIFKVVGNFRLF